MVLLFLLLGSDAQVCDKYDVHDIDWKVVCICAHYGLFKHQTRTWQKKSGQKIGSKVLNLFLTQGTCRNTYYIYKNIYIRDKLRAPNNLQIRGQYYYGIRVELLTKQKPTAKSSRPKAPKKCPQDKSPKNILGTVSNVGFWLWAFGHGLKIWWANGNGQMAMQPNAHGQNWLLVLNYPKYIGFCYLMLRHMPLLTPFVQSLLDNFL